MARGIASQTAPSAPPTLQASRLLLTLMVSPAGLSRGWRLRPEAPALVLHACEIHPVS